MVRKIVEQQMCNVCESEEEVEECSIRIGPRSANYDLCATHRKGLEEILETVRPNEPIKKKRNSRAVWNPEDIPRSH